VEGSWFFPPKNDKISSGFPFYSSKVLSGKLPINLFCLDVPEKPGPLNLDPFYDLGLPMHFFLEKLLMFPLYYKVAVLQSGNFPKK
jgi:hypothetical protein